MKNIIHLDPDLIPLTKHGVSKYNWPIRINYLNECQDELVTQLSSYFKSNDIDNNKNIEILWLNLLALISEIMEVVSASIFNNYVINNKCHVIGGCNNRLLIPTINSKVPELSKYTFRIMSGLAKPNFLSYPNRIVKTILSSPSIGYCSKYFLKRNGVPVTLSVSPLIIKHQSILNTKVVLSKQDEWIPVGKVSRSDICDVNIDKEWHEIKTIIQGFSIKHDIKIPEVLYEYLKNNTYIKFIYTRYYLAKINKNLKYFPDDLWIGTAGSYWNRLIARVARNNGTVISGHDHGTSSGWWDTYFQSILEFDHVDKFYTFSDSMKKGLKDGANEIHLVNKKKCDVKYFDSFTEEKYPLKIKKSKNIKKIMYVSTIYCGEDVSMLPLYHDVTMLDWQCRLFSKLSKWGFDILFRPHPESYKLPPKQLLNLNKIQLVQGKFSNALKEADLIMLDYPQTSTLIETLKSNKPIVLFDFPRIKITDKAKSLLSKRVSMVSGYVNDENRLEVDFDCLLSAIKESEYLENNQFINTYFH